MHKEVQVVAALIKQGDKILICQRPKNKGCALLWEFVGGKVEQGESKEQALVRECKEELEIDIEVGKEFFFVSHTYPDVTVHLTLFLARILRGVPQKIEHNDVKWITVKQIDSFEFCPADEVIIEKIKEVYGA